MNPKAAKAAKDIPIIWPVLRLPWACISVGTTVGEESDVRTASNSPVGEGVEFIDGVDDDMEADVLVEGACVVDDDGGDGIEVEEDDGEGPAVGTGGRVGAPVAVAIFVASILVAAGAPMVGGRAEEKALESGVNFEVAIGTTVSNSCEGLMA